MSSSWLSLLLLLMLGSLLLVSSSVELRGSTEGLSDEAGVDPVVDVADCDCILFRTESKSAFALEVESGDGGMYPFSAVEVLWGGGGPGLLV